MEIITNLLHLPVEDTRMIGMPWFLQATGRMLKKIKLPKIAWEYVIPVLLVLLLMGTFVNWIAHFPDCSETVQTNCKVNE